MRRLIVMRHAKSAWDTGAASDHARPLAGRGRRDAPRVAAYLARAGWVPERVISSDSERTRETWELMADAFADAPVDVTFTHHLYGGGLDELEEVLSDQDDVETVLVLGHNPGWEEVVYFLSGREVSMTTANAALLEGSHETWLDGFEGRGLWTLVDVVRPKEIDE